MRPGRRRALAGIAFFAIDWALLSLLAMPQPQALIGAFITTVFWIAAMSWMGLLPRRGRRQSR